VVWGVCCVALYAGDVRLWRELAEAENQTGVAATTPYTSMR
jgi:hypothetical protein